MHRCFGKWAVVLAVGLSALTATESFAAGNPNGSSRSGGGTKPSFSTLLTCFDRNVDGALGKTEVPANLWNRLKAADTNGDNLVTRSEYDGYVPSGRPAAR